MKTKEHTRQKHDIAVKKILRLQNNNLRFGHLMHHHFRYQSKMKAYDSAVKLSRYDCPSKLTHWLTGALSSEELTKKPTTILELLQTSTTLVGNIVKSTTISNAL